jgi:hypothetical protein
MTSKCSSVVLNALCNLSSEVFVVTSPAPQGLSLTQVFGSAFGQVRQIAMGKHLLGWSTERAAQHQVFLISQFFATIGYEMPETVLEVD